MRTTSCIFVTLVAAAALSFCHAAHPSVLLKQWESLLAKKGGALVFDVYRESGPHWPKKLESADDQEKIRQDIAPSVIRDAKGLVHRLATASKKQVWSRIDACLRIRNDALQDACYSDLVLADALTRAVAIALSKQLGDDATSNQGFQDALVDLQANAFSIAKWCALAENEFGFSADAFAEVKGASTEEGAFKLFWNVISPNDDLGIPADIEKSGSLDLLKKPNLPLLFYRVICTDVLVKTLAVASDYKSKSKDFSLGDSEEKIAAVVPAPVSQTLYSIRANGIQKKLIQLDPEKYTIGERVLGLQISYPEVARLLQAIRSKDIDKQLFYDVSDVLPSKTE